MAKGNIIFIIGCGRSGTHMLASFLRQPATVVRYEEYPEFAYSIHSARNHNAKKTWIPLLIERYQGLMAKFYPQVIVDKCHPNLWHVEELAKAFPNALFLGIERSPHGVINSMWHMVSEAKEAGSGITLRQRPYMIALQNAMSLGVPCPWWGIYETTWFNKPVLDQYFSKWEAHWHKMTDVMAKYGNKNMLYVQYEKVAAGDKITFQRMANFLGLELAIPKTLKPDRIDGWREELPKHIADRITHLQKESIGEKWYNEETDDIT